MAMIRGVSMLERVWRMATSISLEKRVVIATDDSNVAQFASSFGAESIMTATDCRTGMDRAAEAFSNLKSQHSIVVSLQADAVLTPPWVLEETIVAILAKPRIHIATPAVRMTGKVLEQYLVSKAQGSSTGTTVVCDSFGRALYFSKGVIPHCRNVADRSELLRHIGLYAFRPEILLRLAALPESPLEKIEKLEQLRALENGIGIDVVLVDYRGRTHASVDNPEDIPEVESIIEREGELFN